MSRAATGQPAVGTDEKPRSIGREVLLFLLLACVLLPIVMVGAIAAYGFFVWFMQIMFWGPPT